MERSKKPTNYTQRKRLKTIYDLTKDILEKKDFTINEIIQILKDKEKLEEVLENFGFKNLNVLKAFLRSSSESDAHILKRRPKTGQTIYLFWDILQEDTQEKESLSPIELFNMTTKEREEREREVILQLEEIKINRTARKFIEDTFMSLQRFSEEYQKQITQHLNTLVTTE